MTKISKSIDLVLHRRLVDSMRNMRRWRIIKEVN
jgi:hypothetical protein